MYFVHVHLFINVPVCFQTAKVAEQKQNSPSGINHYHTTFLLIIQIGFVIAWALYLQVHKCLCINVCVCAAGNVCVCKYASTTPSNAPSIPI